MQGAGLGYDRCIYISMSMQSLAEPSFSLLVAKYLFTQQASLIIMSLPDSAIAYQLEHIHDNLQPNIYVACFVCLPAAFIAVALRLWARRMTIGGWGKDDFVATCIWGKHRIVFIRRRPTRSSQRMLIIISNGARYGQAANPDEPGKCGDLREGKSM
jgi:hypothetical protein